MRSSRLNFFYLQQGHRTQKHIIHDSLYVQDEYCANSVVSVKFSSPNDLHNREEHDLYIVAKGAVCDWQTKENYIAHYDGVWNFLAPKKGMVYFVRDEMKWIFFNGEEWIWI